MSGSVAVKPQIERGANGWIRFYVDPFKHTTDAASGYFDEKDLDQSKALPGSLRTVAKEVCTIPAVEKISISLNGGNTKGRSYMSVKADTGQANKIIPVIAEMIAMNGLKVEA